MFCGVGSDHSLLCTDHPTIAIGSPTFGGYHDVPCSGEAPQNACASPVPTADPTAVAAARSLNVARLQIPIDHAGTYTIPVGDATLPNGILSDASFGLADDAPADLVLSDPGVYLAVTSLDGGRPFFNAYDHGWQTGVEHVAASLTFTVESFDPGAVLTVTNLVVR